MKSGSGIRRRVAVTISTAILAIGFVAVADGVALAAHTTSGGSSASSATHGNGQGNNGNGKGNGGSASSSTSTTTSAPAASPSPDPGNSNHSQGNAGTSGTYNSPQPLSNADKNSGGANGGCPGTTKGDYCSTRNGSPSGNGNQTTGKHTGEPCAGCVGKADNKNPKGQFANGSDHNAGYECDRNNGIGKTNPAHTGCTSSSPSPSPSCTPSSSNNDCGPSPSCTPSESNNNCGPSPSCTPSSSNNNCGPSPSCTPSSSNNNCEPSPSCTPTAANHFCSNVKGEHFSHSPSPQPSTRVLGERFVNGSLPFTGADITLMALVALLALGGGAAMTVASRRKRATSED